MVKRVGCTLPDEGKRSNACYRQGVASDVDIAMNHMPEYVQVKMCLGTRPKWKRAQQRVCLGISNGPSAAPERRVP